MSEMFQELVEQAPDGVVILDSGRIVFINATAARLLGVERAAALGTLITSYLPPADAAATVERIRTMLATGEPMMPNEYGTLADPHRTVEIKSIPWTWDGKRAVLAFARDVTERKALQQQVVRADRLAAVGTLAAGVAHEINNPLQYIQLGLELIARTLERYPDVHGAIADNLEHLGHGVTRIAAITRTLRGFARKSDAGTAPVDAVAVIDRTLDMVANELRHRARVVRDISVTQRYVIANAPHLEQVVVNLVVNAMQSLTGTDNTITVTLRPHGADRVALLVQDTGGGMSAEVLDRVFDPFFTTKPPNDGMGLGLSVSKSLVEAMGGDITLASEVGRGTTATVILRAHSGAEPSDDSVVDPGPRRRVLVIDDEQRVHDMLRELLGPYHDVTAVDSGAAALAQIANGSFDVILCDVMMPSMSGVDVFRWIAETHPGLEERIVFMSGGAFFPELAEFVAAQRNPRIEKPFALGQLLTTIAALA